MVTVNHITELNRVTQGHKIHALFHGNYRKHGNTNETSITIYSELPFVFGCVTVVPDVASYSKLYRYRGHVYPNHRNPGVMSLVTMETGIHGKWHVTQVTHKNYAEIAKPSQAKVLTGGGDLREAQVDVPLSVSHSCV